MYIVYMCCYVMHVCMMHDVWDVYIICWGNHTKDVNIMMSLHVHVSSTECVYVYCKGYVLCVHMYLLCTCIYLQIFDCWLVRKVPWCTLELCLVQVYSRYGTCCVSAYNMYNTCTVCTLNCVCVHCVCDTFRHEDIWCMQGIC